MFGFRIRRDLVLQIYGVDNRAREKPWKVKCRCGKIYKAQQVRFPMWGTAQQVVNEKDDEEGGPVYFKMCVG